MKSQIIEITCRSKMGWDYNCSPIQTERGYKIPAPTKPHWVGTYRQVRDAISKDRSFQALGGSYYTMAWFVKYKGAWHRIVEGTLFGYWREGLEDDGFAAVEIEKVQ